MNRYLVTVDVHYSRHVAVKAKNEEEAKEQGIKMGAYVTGEPEENISIYDVELEEKDV